MKPQFDKTLFFKSEHCLPLQDIPFSLAIMRHKNSLTRAENKTEDLLQSVLEAGSSGLDGIRGLVREQFASKVRTSPQLCKVEDSDKVETSLRY